MPLVTAKFELSFSAPCLLQWLDGSVPEAQLSLSGFDIRLRLIPDDSQAAKFGDEPHFTKRVAGIILTVSKDQPTEPPPVELNKGARDYTNQSRYLNGLLPEYRSTALTVANNVLRFFKYRLHTPLVQFIPQWDRSASNPSWSIESGVALRSGGHIIMQPMPGSRGELGVQKLAPERISDLRQFLEAPQEPSLADDLLSDSQSAWFEGQLRRSILELAICVETTVKRKFFDKTSAAGVAFDYFEDKSRISVRVTELIDVISKEAFSRSYKTEYPNEYQQIDYLFRCRNKVVHRGELTFRDDAATLFTCDKEVVAQWWSTVAHLLQWINALP